MSKHIHSLVQDGYVETAPACGDCKWSDPEPQGLLCKRLLVLVHDNGRCLKWAPAAHWLRANPLVAQHYTDAGDALSPAELAYAHKKYALDVPTKTLEWPFPTASN